MTGCPTQYPTFLLLSVALQAVPGLALVSAVRASAGSSVALVALAVPVIGPHCRSLHQKRPWSRRRRAARRSDAPAFTITGTELAHRLTDALPPCDALISRRCRHTPRHALAPVETRRQRGHRDPALGAQPDDAMSRRGSARARGSRRAVPEAAARSARCVCLARDLREARRRSFARSATASCPASSMLSSSPSSPPKRAATTSRRA